jgi:HEPN domain-containing protein
MSVERLEREARRWLAQATDDLDAARTLVNAGKNAQGAFLAQQAGEKALKALWIRLDLDPWGHSIARWVKDLPSPWSTRLHGLLEPALALDKLYIPTRYPDALAELTPAEAYTHKEADVALRQAQTLIDASTETLAAAARPA